LKTEFSNIRKLALSILFAIICLSANTQSYIIKSIKDFGAKGNGKTNDQPAFEKASSFFNARGGRGKLVIPKGVYIVGKQDLKAGVKEQHVINLSHCKDLVIEGDQAVIRFRDSLRFGAFDPRSLSPFRSTQAVFAEYAYAAPIGNSINLTNCEHVFIRNVEVDGNQRGMILGGKYGDTGFQLAHDGIAINNCADILLEKLYVHHMGRDGVQLANNSPAKWLTPDQKIVIKDSRFEYNGRQGLSWVGGSGLKVTNSKFNFTGKSRILSAPGAGIDIEAEIGIIQNGIFENCEFIDNGGCGMVADNGESRHMLFTNCLFWGTGSWSMWTTKPDYTFVKCKFYGSIVQGHDAVNQKDATRFIQCLFEDKSYNGKPAFGNYLVEVNFKRRMFFGACTFISSTKKIWWFDGDPAWKDEEKPVMRNARIIAKMTRFPEGDFISVKHCLKEGGSVYELYFPKSKRYFEAGGNMVDLGNNKLIWKN
jgi:hypothetical protein